MIIETVNNPKHNVEIKFENLPSGTVFQFVSNITGKPGPIMLKLGYGESVLLNYSTGDECFEIHDGSMNYRKIAKVWGKLVGLKVQL